MPDLAGKLLSGWGRTAPTRASVETPASDKEVADLFSEVDRRGVIARGLGRSYGDAAQCAGGTVVDVGRLDDVSDVGPGGEIEVGGGTSLDALVRRVLPEGWFLPVTPGTRQVTIGGAIAADVHGKNHHVDGSFARHVSAMTVATPTGVHRVSPGDDPELFWATSGGMGLTGIVTSAVVRMLPVETDRVIVDTDRFPDLDGVMAAMEEGDAAYRYSVAWVDCSRHGRAVLTRGRHAALSEIPTRERGRPLEPSAPPLLHAPRRVPPGLLNRLSITAFNEAWYRRAPAHREGEVQSMWRFFHPLDGVEGWNRLYGPRGFLQYQFAVPPDRGGAVRQAIAELSQRRIPSFLAVLKRFGPSSPGPLSFPVPGWTLALDVPVGPVGLPECLDRLDELVAEEGGRVYLAKDSRLRPDLVETMYPRLEELRTVRRRVDPEGLIRSDLSLRLGLD
jgi:decaprenylphospho-beta-D-ribofuranose 2-oxidase